MLCYECAPDIEAELASAQVNTQVEQMKSEAPGDGPDQGHEPDQPKPPPLCPACGAHTQGAKFCPECGKPLRPKNECSRCGTVAEAGTKFCPECGNKMA